MEFTENRGRFGLGNKPTRANMKRIVLARRERSSAHPQEPQVKRVPFCHIDKSFVSAWWMYEGRVAVINDETPKGQSNWVRSCAPKFELGNWQVVKQPGIFVANIM